MASDDGAGALVTLLGSPAVRNASLALLAAAGVLLSVRSLASTSPSPPPPPPPRTLANNDGHHLRREEIRDEEAVRRGADVVGSARDNLNGGKEFERFVPPHRRNDRTHSSASSIAGGGGSASKIAIAIFWDVDNCQPNSGASGHEVAQAIRRAAQSTGPDAERLGSIVSFKAYLELSNENTMPNAAQVQLRSELQGSGVSLIDTPKSGRKDVADKMMIADLLAYAIDKRPPALIVLLSGDRDFAYPLGILRNRGYEILLITPPIGSTPILEASANYKLRWRQDVLGLEFDAQGRPYDRTKGTSISAVAAPSAGAPSRVLQSTENASKPGPVGPTPNSIKERQAHSVPPVFEPLVTVLMQMRNEGHSHPLRSLIASRLKSADPQVFERAQASGWGEYVAIAEAAGIVTLGPGSQAGREWVSLRSSSSSKSEAQQPSISILKKEANFISDVPANVASTPIGNDVKMFFPLIEAHKALKVSLPAGHEPMTRDLAAIIDDMSRTGTVDPYQQARVPAYDAYLRQAYRAKIARLAPPENGEKGTVVQLHPKYVSMSTGFVLPSSTTVLINDKAKASWTALATNDRRPSTVTLPYIGESLKVAEDEDLRSASNTAAEWSTASKTKAGATKESKASHSNISNINSVKSTSLLCYAHQPSGEVIHTSYFPMVNYLLTQRAAGQFATSEQHVFISVSKHHKLGRIVQTQKDFHEYLAKAVSDDIVNVIRVEGEPFVCLHERLCKGEGEGRHRGFRYGHNSRPERDDQSAGRPSPPSSRRTQSIDERDAREDDEPISSDPIAPPPPSTHFATVTPTSRDRQKLKHLVEAMVSLRKRMTAKAQTMIDSKDDHAAMLHLGIEPLRSTVISTLLQMSVAEGAPGSDGETLSAVKPPPLTPGAWLQEHGYTSFGELFNEAERKGFVHLLTRADGRERLRLAQRYEEMFFPNEGLSPTTTY